MTHKNKCNSVISDDIFCPALSPFELLERCSELQDGRKNGFTLVELAIALMVIGLLIGGVLKGQELIENAKALAAVREIKAYDTAAMIFRSTYNALPADINNPGTRIPNCTDICASGGNKNGIVSESSAPANEYWNFFVHLTKAGMVKGPEGGTEADKAPTLEKFLPQITGYSGEAVMALAYFTSMNGVVIGMANDIPIVDFQHYNVPLGSLKFAERIDSKIDDGMPCTGDAFPYDDINDLGGCTSLSTNSYTALSQAVGSSPYNTMNIKAGF